MDDDRRLSGVQCNKCSTVDFPAQFFGCTHCGAPGEHLIETRLAPTGQILAAAALHMARPGIEAGSVVARMRLDEGPVVYGLLGPEEADLPALPCVAALHINGTITIPQTKEK